MPVLLSRCQYGRPGMPGNAPGVPGAAHRVPETATPGVSAAQQARCRVAVSVPLLLALALGALCMRGAASRPRAEYDGGIVVRDAAECQKGGGRWRSTW